MVVCVCACVCVHRVGARVYVNLCVVCVCVCVCVCTAARTTQQFAQHPHLNCPNLVCTSAAMASMKSLLGAEPCLATFQMALASCLGESTENSSMMHANSSMVGAWVRSYNCRCALHGATLSYSQREVREGQRIHIKGMLQLLVVKHLPPTRPALLI